MNYDSNTSNNSGSRLGSQEPPASSVPGTMVKYFSFVIIFFNNLVKLNLTKKNNQTEEQRSPLAYDPNRHLSYAAQSMVIYI